ncbi:MAG: hypothetical protein IJ558_03855 [Treponema sp.]|nr:hypothetical protein [Treponema sp.]
MRKLIILACIFVSLRVNVSALTFSETAFDSPCSESGQLSSFSFSSREKSDDENEAESMLAYAIGIGCILFGIGYYWLNNVRFFDYPYDENATPADGNYIARGALSGLRYTDPGYSRNRFTFDTSLVYLHGFGFGSELRFEGLFFPYVGPYFENLVLCNPKNGDSDVSHDGFRDNVKIGGQLSLLQTNIFSATLIVLYTNWLTEHFADFKRGCNVGFLLRSYPIRPLVIEWRFGWQLYSGDFQVSESDFHVGYMLNRYELFASFKSLMFLNTEDDDFFDDFYGLSLGARVYFSL